ncbi:aminopeptidase P N-terminal domain-containing protein, partial [candidate division KSB1 bacterium]|nr:aminopeptidase P N-terminal domain-containing protein [candidate division KSB1 bacterium]
MFDTQIYVQRRKHLKQQLSSGLLLFPGNNESPMNYPDNAYRFRQDSSFLYYFGLDFPGLAAVMDLDTGSETIYGDDLTVDEVVWMGPQPTMRERCANVGVQDVLPANKFADVVQKAAAKVREVHFLPQYRGDTIILLADILGLAPKMLNGSASQAFIRAVVLQRSVKAPEEVAEIEIALDITHKMHIYAMKMTTPGVVEQEIVGDLLVYMDKEVPSRNDLVETPSLTAVHERLVEANHLEKQIHEEGIELMSFLENDAVSRAEQLAEDLRSLADAHGLIADHPW